MKLQIRDLTLLAVSAAVLFISQVAFAFLPNIEPVSLLVILFTLFFRKKVFYIIYLFTLLEGVFYGFGLWWFNYLYVWTILALIVLILKEQPPVIYAFISGGFGLAFGFLCSLPYFITGGLFGGLAYWSAGIPFDIVHGISNFIVALALFAPLHRLFKTLLHF